MKKLKYVKAPGGTQNKFEHKKSLITEILDKKLTLSGLHPD